jgi:hypothetical protein
MFNPAARLVNKVISDPYVVTSLFCALFGALCVLGCAYLFYQLAVPWPRSLLYAGLFGLTSTNLIFSTIPDTYIFSAAGLIALLIAVVRKPPVWVWAIISVYLVGINLVNAAFIVIAITYAKLIKGSNGQWLPRWSDVKSRSKQTFIVKFLAQSVALFLGLVVIQKVALNFWLLSRPREPLKDIQYLFLPETFTEAGVKLINLGEHLFYFNILAPLPKLVQHLRNPDILLVSFRESNLLDYPAIAWPGLLIWTAILGLATWAIIKYRLFNSPIVKITIVSLLANAVIFFLYGDDIMLYACEWTFFLIVMVALGLEKFIQGQKQIQANSLLALFLTLVFLNNLYFQWQMFAFIRFTN